MKTMKILVILFCLHFQQGWSQEVPPPEPPPEPTEPPIEPPLPTEPPMPTEEPVTEVPVTEAPPNVTENWANLTIVTRAEWGAAAAKTETKFKKTPDNVVIHHTATPANNCKARVKSIQEFHQKSKKKDGKGWDDIGYNFLICNDGKVYEGRGWGNKGAHAGSKMNSKSIGIAFIGDYCKTLPSKKALEAAKTLIACAVEQKKIVKKYKLKVHKEVKDAKTDCPGAKLHAEIKTWANYKKG